MNNKVVGLERRGLLIAFEGGEFLGKSTQFKMAYHYLRQRYLSHVSKVSVREPGSTDYGEIIRFLLLNPEIFKLKIQALKVFANSAISQPETDYQNLEYHLGLLREAELFAQFEFQQEMSPLTEAYLFQAARAQLWQEKIIPELNLNKIVLVDRCGYSSDVYQGIVRGLGFDVIENLNNMSTQGYRPDLTLIFSIEPEVGLDWIIKRSRNNALDRIENEKLEFHKMVYEAYLSLKDLLPKELSATLSYIDVTRYFKNSCKFSPEQAIQDCHERVTSILFSFIEEHKRRLSYS